MIGRRAWCGSRRFVDMGDGLPLILTTLSMMLSSWAAVGLLRRLGNDSLPNDLFMLKLLRRDCICIECVSMKRSAYPPTPLRGSIGIVEWPGTELTTRAWREGCSSSADGSSR